MNHHSKLIIQLFFVCFYFFQANSYAEYAALAKSELLKSTKKIKETKQTILGMSVTATTDLPNVLYIVPWKNSQGKVAPPKIKRLVDEIYAPVDPVVFSKQVKFYYQLTDKSQLKAVEK